MESVPIEIEIQRLLDEHKSLPSAADFLVQKIAAPETSDPERFAYWTFLYHAGLYRQLLKSMCLRLNEKQRIHWGLFVETLGRLKEKPSTPLLAATLKGIKRQNGFEDLWGTYVWDAFEAKFAEYRAAIYDAKLKLAQERRGVLLEKFHFLQSQRMHEQAERTIKRLVFLFPDDDELRKFKEAFIEERAREVLADKFYGEPLLEVKANSLTDEEESLLQIWVSEATRILETHPEAAHDLALLFLFSEADEPALTLNNAAKDSPRRDWLVAELLFRLRRYVDLLEFLNMMESHYLDDPETAFGVAYLRAQALNEMGQSATAVEILRNIVQVRPNYRSANHLINEWSVGVATG